MKMSGFTAEMSIYRSVEGYFLASSTIDLTGIFTARLSHFNSDFHLRFLGEGGPIVVVPPVMIGATVVARFQGLYLKLQERNLLAGYFKIALEMLFDF